MANVHLVLATLQQKQETAIWLLSCVKLNTNSLKTFVTQAHSKSKLKLNGWVLQKKNHKIVTKNNFTTWI